MRRQGGGVQNHGGEPHGFIGATDVRRATILLDLCACHDTSPRHIMGYAPVIPILSHQSRAGRFAFPGRPGLFSCIRDTGQKAFLRPAWAQEFEGWPNSFDGRPNEGWARERPKLRRTSLKEVSICDRVSTGLTMDESPRTGYQGSL